MVYGALKATVGLRLSQEEEFDGADLSPEALQVADGQFVRLGFHQPVLGHEGFLCGSFRQ